MDNDKFPPGIAACWRKPYKAIKAGASPEEIAPMCAPALAQFFQDKGCPGFEQGRDLLKGLCYEDDQLIFGGRSYDEIYQLCDKIVRNYAGNPQSSVAAYVMEAVKELAFKAQTEGPLEGKPDLLLAQQVCLEVVNATFIAKLDGTKVLETFLAKNDNNLVKAQDNLCEWKEKLASALPTQLEQVAKKLAADSSGRTVKARAVRSPKRSTLETLYSFGRLDVSTPADSEVGIS